MAKPMKQTIGLGIGHYPHPSNGNINSERSSVLIPYDLKRRPLLRKQNGGTHTRISDMDPRIRSRAPTKPQSEKGTSRTKV